MPAKPLSLNDTVITCLTDMTGRKASEARQVMIPKINVDVPKRSLAIFLWALVPALFTAFLVVWVLGVPWLAGLGGFAVTEGAAFWLFQRRTREGLQVRTYTEILDRKKRPVHVLMLGGVEIDPSGGGPGTIVAASVPVPPGGPGRHARRHGAARLARLPGKDT